MQIAHCDKRSAYGTVSEPSAVANNGTIIRFSGEKTRPEFRAMPNAQVQC